MAWTCSGVSNQAMVRKLELASLISTPAVIDAFHRVDRGWFVSDYHKGMAYNDSPLPIGYGATISAPHMHAIMVEILAPYLLQPEGNQNKRVLDIGSGSGYLTVILAMLCGPGSQVIGVEHVEQLRQRSSDVVKKHFAQWVNEGRISFIKGDGRDISKLFPNSQSSFDVIHVGAAAASVPQTYFDSLKPGGCLVIPVGEEDATQFLRIYRKDLNGKVEMKTHGRVQFVPLTSLGHQIRRQ
ncbi:protein-L-isoaspartate O-methyltransferase [Trypanosoma theileri]|uniref:protein-L-isoaspartate(D-aspartate) O-methyltransferase n=1 Tax=Trypanosoma theileri TaxID=67003 RepID=A0A1X0NLD3_9TRYP|nr:protein-L-isoaspartate O-methyltransferase [Trypanosoma theileri]ORC85545.1 protein-L-isoaspartate O-methyltransferase [Trypanosoma theileri]